MKKIYFNNQKIFYRLITIILVCIFSADWQLAYAGPNDIERTLIAQLELGPVWQSRNDVQIPNDPSTTRFSLVDLVGSGPYPGIRLYLTWRIAKHHDLRLMLAPLRYTESGEFSEQTGFAGQTYQPDEPVNATYQFNSWRLTYRYKFHHGEKWHWWIGFTAKIRDAIIKLEQNSLSSEKTDLGFVPLLHLRGEFHINDTWWTLLDVDALAGGPGRAIDGTLQVGYDINDHWSVSGGYRTVEGGADVEEVYNFAWLHYLSISANYAF